MPVNTIEWKENKVHIIDQTRLPGELVYMEIDELPVLEEAIRKLRVRGAPAIGVAGAMGAALAAVIYDGDDAGEMTSFIRRAMDRLSKTRPTAVNLFWALARMEKTLQTVENQSVAAIRERLVQEAQIVWQEDRDICRRMGRNGAELLPQKGTVLTHCNAGGLATADFGTALGVIYAAQEAGKEIKVYSDETRPLLQGSRLTAWELMQSGIDVTILCDSAAGFLMQQGHVDAVIVGADRIAANGDAANKIGTYSLAVLAEKHQIPFYIVAPLSTIDIHLASGAEIPIEERHGDEVILGFGRQTGPAGAKVYNPAFDVTPHELITAIVTEAGVVKDPYRDSIFNLFR